MPSCTVPIFSKIPVMLRATQPAMFVNCQDMGIAVATPPTAMWPAVHCQIAIVEVPKMRAAFMKFSVTV